MNDRHHTTEILLACMALALACLALWLELAGPRPHMDHDGFTETPESEPAVAEHVVIWEPAERPAQRCAWLLDDWQCTEVAP